MRYDEHEARHTTPRHRLQRGAAIILALITVVIAASIAAALIANLGRAIDNARGRQDQAQARLLARASADWARNVLAADAKMSQVDHLQEPWAVKVPATPVNSGDLDGEISGEIQDWSGYFNINNLAPNGIPNANARKEFVRLLKTLNIPAGQAEQLSTALQKWISSTGSGDSDSDASAKNGGAPTNNSVAPRSALADITELRELEGIDEKLFSQIRQYAVALPAPSKINVNTAPAEVLAAIVDDLSIDTARILAAERNRIWFKDVADFTARLPKGAKLGSTSRIDVRSRYFLVTGRASQGGAVVRMQILLDRQIVWPEILWQRIL